MQNENITIENNNLETSDTIIPVDYISIHRHGAYKFWMYTNITQLGLNNKVKLEYADDISNYEIIANKDEQPRIKFSHGKDKEIHPLNGHIICFDLGVDIALNKDARGIYLADEMISLKLEKNSSLFINYNETFYGNSISMADNSNLVMLGDRLSFCKDANFSTSDLSFSLNKIVSIINPNNLELHIAPKHSASENEKTLSLADLGHINNLVKIAETANTTQIPEELKPILGLNKNAVIELSVDNLEDLPNSLSTLDSILNYHPVLMAESTEENSL
ncbi:MAG: hypothetical protein K0Q51_557 [Rickettsiaceae bacterium]|jgi:hypothetical protein|nr:hypothetical protein [Rickettsiaceae bacterium]